jgi:hypothetical protein
LNESFKPRLVESIIFKSGVVALHYVSNEAQDLLPAHVPVFTSAEPPCFHELDPG